MLHFFYQNSWQGMILSGINTRQLTFFRWSWFLSRLFSPIFAWQRISLICFFWAPGIPFFFYNLMLSLSNKVYSRLPKSYFPVTVYTHVARPRIFNWTRRYLIFFIWFFEFILLIPINQNNRIIFNIYDVQSRQLTWLSYWL